jgi:hypothetical protein
MDMNDPTNKAIDQALDKYLSPLLYITIGLGLITFIFLNYWGTILIMLALIAVGYFAIVQREAVGRLIDRLVEAHTHRPVERTSEESAAPQQKPPPERPRKATYRERLIRVLAEQIKEEKLVQPPVEVLELAGTIGAKIVEAESTMQSLLDHSRDAPSFWTAEYQWHQQDKKAKAFLPEHMENMMLMSLLRYFRNFPTYQPGPFSISFSALAPDIPHIIFQMMEPFTDDYLKQHNALQEVTQKYYDNAATVPRTGSELTWPQQFKGPKEEIPKVYLKDHPFLPLFQVSVPIQPFTEENRYAHHWCLGKTGRGKTTFLRHLIRQDLESVAQQRCSLVVLDSKKLIREMRTLQEFAFELEGRLTLIDSDEPFPLNPFTLPRPQARPIIMYMLAEMTAASGLQTGALTYLVDAALQSKKPSLRTMRDFFALDLRKGQMPADFDSFDQDTQHWFQHTFKELPPATRSGIHQRLANFLKEHEFGLARMFEADRFGLDIVELDQGGRVWLVDTDLNENGADGTNLLGRLIIALLEQLTTRRNKEDESRLTPVWCYIDEASDYLKESDPKFVQILTKARSSRIGMTVAYQYRGLVGADVERALENAEIHSECVQRGSVELSVEEKKSRLAVSQLEFSREAQMDRKDYRALRDRLRELYPHRVASSLPAVMPDEPLTQKF